MIPRVVLKKGKAGSAFGGHPWVYDWMIDQIDEGLRDGDVVVVHADDAGKFVGHGVWNALGEIRVRIYSWSESAPVNREFFSARIDEALALRRALGYAGPKDGCRLIYGDAENLSGLVVDRYADALVLQVNASGLLPRLPMLAEVLREKTGARLAQLRLPEILAKDLGRTSMLFGETPAAPIRIEQEGLVWEIDLNVQQKTGFYLDQRANRLSAAAWAKGRAALDLYSYTGGFGIAAAKAGATSVTCVDSSAPAIAAAARNAEHNGAAIDAVVSDVLDYAASCDRKFGWVAIDPPKFAAGASSREKALAMYHRVNQEALGLVAKGGIFVTSSCSGRVATGEWLGMLSSAARRAGRFLKLIELRGASPDHPVSLHCPETAYLKCAIFLVD